MSFDALDKQAYSHLSSRVNKRCLMSNQEQTTALNQSDSVADSAPVTSFSDLVCPNRGVACTADCGREHNCEIGIKVLQRISEYEQSRNPDIVKAQALYDEKTASLVASEKEESFTLHKDHQSDHQCTCHHEHEEGKDSSCSSAQDSSSKKSAETQQASQASRSSQDTKDNNQAQQAASNGAASKGADEYSQDGVASESSVSDSSDSNALGCGEPISDIKGFYGRSAKATDAQKIDEDGDYYKPWLESYSPGVPEFIDAHKFENIPEILDYAVKHYADNVAYSNMGSEMTFDELADQSDYFAAYLQKKLGLGKGDKIAIMMPNLMQFPVAFFGALKAGLTVSNINPLYTPRELKNQLENSDATTIVVISNYANHLEEVIAETKVKNVILTEVGDALGGVFGLKRTLVNFVVRYKGMVPYVNAKKFPFHDTFVHALKIGRKLLPRFKRPQIEYDDIALLQYTGGTTGRSKGAMLSHGNIIANIMQAEGMYGTVLKRGEETILTVIPIYHIFALTVNIVLFVYLGGKNLLITDPRNSKAFVKELKKHPEITAMTGVNTLFNALITNDDFKELKWENLHLVIGGGAAVQSGVEQRFFEKTGFHILEGYGLTECSPLCAVCPYDVDHYTGSIGLIVPSTVARIVDADGNEICDLEHEGELEIKGPQVMHGYYKCDTHNDFIFDDGYVRTGDIAKWMEGGYIKLIDRLKDMILVSGFNVFPNEIEDVVSRFNRVLECAVIGVPSDSTGEAVKLFVVKADESLTASEVKSYCRAYLTPYKVPRIIQFVESLPKSPLGKVLRRKLRDMEGAKPLTAEQQLAAIKAGKVAHPDVHIATSKRFAELAAAQAAQSALNTAGATLAGEPIPLQQLSTATEAPELHGTVAEGHLPLPTSDEQIAAAAASALVSSAESELAAMNEEAKKAEDKLEKSKLAQAVSEEVPKAKSAGALALERLLSSHGDTGLVAAVETPNIHRQEQKSTLVRSSADSRIHVGSAKHDQELDS